jgi:hypothetical protein
VEENRYHTPYFEKLHGPLPNVLRSNRYLPTPGGPDNSAALKKAPVSPLAQGPVKKKKVSASTGSITTDKIWENTCPMNQGSEKGQGISMITSF